MPIDVKRRVERRRQRSENTSEALQFQLEACRARSGLDGMVLADDCGLALAASGDAEGCDEVAARLAVIGRKVGEFAGVLFSGEGAWQVSMRRFAVAGSELYMCAIGAGVGPRDTPIEASIGGCARILAAD